MSDIWVIGWAILFEAMKCITEKVDYEALKKQGGICIQKVVNVLGRVETFFSGCKFPPHFLHFDIIFMYKMLKKYCVGS